MMKATAALLPCMVQLSAATIVCEGLSSDSGSAYVFVRSGTSWTQQAKLVASDAAASDRFGFAVGIADDT
eukprot:COSAG05_NODE_10371_length_569_cov_0.557447_1_plen_69_part_01